MENPSEMLPNIIPMSNVSKSAIHRKWKKCKSGTGTSDVSDHRGKHRRIFSDEEEKILAAMINAKVEGKKEIVDREVVRRESINLFRQMYTNCRCHKRQFSNGFIAGFKARHGFSNRDLYCDRQLSDNKKVSVFDDCTNFLVYVVEAIQKYGEHLVFNFDETPAKIVDLAKSAWGKKGDKGKLLIQTKKCEKDNITLLPCVTASGKILSFGWIKKKVTTPDTIIKMNLPNHIHSFWSWTGYTNSKMMIHYVNQVIIPYTKGRPCALVLDSCDQHWEMEFTQHCEQNKIELIKVPEGQTKYLQPLDISFNSEFKIHRQTLAKEALLLNSDTMEDLKNVVLRAAEAYSKVHKSTILRGWDVFNFNI